MKFDRNDYYTFLINGDLPGAIAYLKQFSDKEDLYKSFINRFERGQFDTFEDDPVNNILTAYQSYYRDILSTYGQKAGGSRPRKSIDGDP